MASPFPGMNPYLEQPDVWNDFHDSFLYVLRADLAAQVDPNYIVKIEEQLYIHELPADQRRLIGRADAAVARSGTSSKRATTAAVLTAPTEIELPDIDIESINRVEVRDRLNRELVTVVELLSPSNKNAGADREQYKSKRLQIIHSPVHLVELDLLRGGSRMPMRKLPECDYCIFVSRSQERPRAGLWPIRLRERLPLIPIPLRSPDPDVRLDLQQILQEVYEAAHYETYIYDGAPVPALSSADAAWARKLLPRRR
jgi:hypothetical protein